LGVDGWVITDNGTRSPIGKDNLVRPITADYSEKENPVVSLKTRC